MFAAVLNGFLKARLKGLITDGRTAGIAHANDLCAMLSVRGVLCAAVM